MYYLSLSIALLAVLLESVSYFGFIENKLGLSSLVFYALSLIFSIYAKQIKAVPPKLIKLAITLTSDIYLILIALETYFYPNYLYSHLHLNPAVLQFALALFSYHLLIHLKLKFPQALLYSALIYVGVDGTGRTLGLASRKLGYFLAEPLLTYDQKLAKVYPGFYPTMKEIVRLTPENSTIFIPPQSNPWELEGNGAMVRYFVYPRTVKNLSDNLFVPKVEGSGYVLVAKGSAKARTTAYDYGWPKSTWTGKKAWKLNSENILVEQPENTYIYDPDNLWEWGLIEVDYAE
ncbi:MAG: hypothetical protein DPW11_00810 [bacterium]|nr:hypothetical protein [Candidatus Microgenomates bacterium CPR3]MCQ3944308.1 hypothetical protein [bacterium]RIK51024.1 MAG: hypothetical protein DCC61_03890 [Candidatus Microgenomates bacterium]